MGKLTAMSKIPHRTASPGANADAVEATFYGALRSANLDLLMTCWAEDEEIVCILPGRPRLVGAGAIRAAFERMFAYSPVFAWPQHVHRIDTITASVHSVIELVEVIHAEGPRQTWVTSTNIYFKTMHGWRLVMHHACPGIEQPPVEAKELGQQLLH